MKTSLLYGCLLTLASAIFTLVMFFAGAHTDPEKMNSMSTPSMLFFLVLGFVILILGMRARRAETPLDQGFGYGSALATGAGIALVAAVTGTAFQLLYENFINPNFIDVQIHANSLKLAAKGISDAKIEQSESMMRKFANPAVRAVVSLVAFFIFNFICALIAAIFCTRKDPNAATSL